jgi:hypothetical protein
MASAGAAPARVREEQQPAIAVVKPSLFVRVTSGAACFHWIAGLTLLNSMVVLSRRSLHFVIALGVTTAVDEKAKGLGATGVALDLLINGMIAGVFFWLGHLAGRRIRWAFLVGMVLYGFDGVLLFAAKDMLSVALHAYSLFAISRGLTAEQA